MQPAVNPGLASAFVDHVAAGGQQPSTMRTRQRGRTHRKREQQRANARLLQVAAINREIDAMKHVLVAGEHEYAR